MRGLAIVVVLAAVVLLAAGPAEAGWIFRGGCSGGQCGQPTLAPPLPAAAAEAAPEAPVSVLAGDCGIRHGGCCPAATGAVCGVVEAGKAVVAGAAR